MANTSSSLMLKDIRRRPFGTIANSQQKIVRSFSSSSSSLSSEDSTIPPTSTVVFLRHGQSTWNKIPTFSGWCDVPLTDLGIEQAEEAGTLLSDNHYTFDLCYTSTLKRAYNSAEVVLQTMNLYCGDDHNGFKDDRIDNSCDDVPKSRSQNTKNLSCCPLIKAWQLNERHYGELQGQAKASPSLHQKYGTEQITAWRRDMHARPPPIHPLHPYYVAPPDAPLTESLYDSQQRALKYWHETIVPSMMTMNKSKKITVDDNTLNSNNILIVAHANTIRGLVAFLDNIEDEDVPKIHIANSVPLVYDIDPTTGRAVSTESNRITSTSSKGRWLLSACNQGRLLDKLGPNSEAFARSVFEAWDTNKDGVLSRTELTRGLSAWKRDPNPAINALAGKIWEELLRLESQTKHGITMEMLRDVTVVGCRRHNLPFYVDDTETEETDDLMERQEQMA